MSNRKLIRTVVLIIFAIICLHLSKALLINIGLKRLVSGEDGAIKEVVQHRVVGNGGFSEKHRIFEFLYFIMNNKETANYLLASEHSNLRCYGVWMLARRGEKEMILRAIAKEKAKSENVIYSGPCEGWTGESFDFMIEMITINAYKFQVNISPLSESEYDKINYRDYTENEVQDRNIPLKGQSCCSHPTDLLLGFMGIIRE